MTNKKKVARYIKKNPSTAKKIARALRINIGAIRTIISRLRTDGVNIVSVDTNEHSSEVTYAFPENIKKTSHNDFYLFYIVFLLTILSAFAVIFFLFFT